MHVGDIVRLLPSAAGHLFVVRYYNRYYEYEEFFHAALPSAIKVSGDRPVPMAFVTVLLI